MSSSTLEALIDARKRAHGVRFHAAEVFAPIAPLDKSATKLTLCGKRVTENSHQAHVQGCIKCQHIRNPSSNPAIAA